MRTKFLMSVFFFLWEDKLFSHPSLLFSESEVSSIRKNLSQSPPLSKNSDNLNLLAIVYFDENHWCVWVNHKIIRPENSHDIDGFRLEKVTPHEATFSWLPSESLTPKKFTLYPHQTYIAKEQRIVGLAK